jgi:hypothetical protein
MLVRAISCNGTRCLIPTRLHNVRIGTTGTSAPHPDETRNSEGLPKNIAEGRRYPGRAAQVRTSIARLNYQRLNKWCEGGPLHPGEVLSENFRFHLKRASQARPQTDLSVRQTT